MMKINTFNKVNLLLILQFSWLISMGQISTNEVPYGLSTKEMASMRNVVELKIPDMQKVIREDSSNDNNGWLERISVPIPVKFNIEDNGEWSELSDGGSLWRLTVSATGAKSLDFVFSQFWLPKGGKFFIYNPETKESIGAITSQFLEGNIDTPSDFSTGIILGDKMTLEYYQPKSIREKPIINISSVYYGYRYVGYYRNFNASGDCQVNINCPEGDNWQKEKEAVARIYVKTPTGGGWCSGSLVNNTANNLEPLFLTANHCLDGYFDALGNDDLSKWIFYWHYEHPTCSDSNIEPPIYSTVGAKIKANNSISDFALLKLKQDLEI